MIEIAEYAFKAGLKKPLRLAYLSDFHHARNKPIIEAISTLAPDALLLGGDLIHDDKRYRRGLEFIEQCASIYPTFFAVGNHECWYGREILEEIERRGATILDNAHAEFEGIKIGGLTSGYPFCRHRRLKQTPPPDLAFLRRFSQEEGFKLLLCHHPEYFIPYIKELPVDLTLSGHAHGGQWRFFGQGIFAPGQGLFPKYTSGLYEGRLLVGRGLGNGHPIPRIGNPPQIIMIELGE